MKRILSCIVVSGTLAVAAGLPAPARAASWVFRPSYYTHDPVTDVHIGTQFDGGPYYTRPQGEYVRSGYRYIQSTIQCGQSLDQSNFYESWVQGGAEY